MLLIIFHYELAYHLVMLNRILILIYVNSLMNKKKISDNYDKDTL